MHLSNLDAVLTRSWPTLLIEDMPKWPTMLKTPPNLNDVFGRLANRLLHTDLP